MQTTHFAFANNIKPRCYWNSQDIFLVMWCVKTVTR